MYGIEIKPIKDKKYKYELLKNYMIQTKLRPASRIVTPYIEVGTDGMMLIRKAYQYDGPSGISFDTDNFMRGSLVHDALYQLIGDGYIGKDQRLLADKLLRRICRADGMSWFRSWYVYRAVRMFGGWHV